MFAQGLRLYRSQGHDATGDLAFEEQLLARAAAGDAGFFVAAWAAPTLVLGYGQPVEDVDLELCRSEGVEVLRRRTGGTGVLHDGQELILSLALPTSHPWTRGIPRLYERFLDTIQATLGELGVELDRVSPEDHREAAKQRSPICFEGQLMESLLWQGKKAVGCAQRRVRGAALVQATLLLGLDAERQARVFGVSRARVDAAMAPLPELGLDVDALATAFEGAFVEALSPDTAPTRGQVEPGDARLRYDEARWSPLKNPPGN